MPDKTSTPLVNRTGLEPMSREAVAAFLMSRQDKLRAIARSRLSKVAQGVNDSEDVFASVLRRVDLMASQGKVRPRSEAELWALAEKIAMNNAISRTRLAKQFVTHIADDPVFVRLITERFAHCETDDEATLLKHRAASAIKCGDDRHLFLLRLKGVAYKVIAEQLEITEVAARWRWGRVVKLVREFFEHETIDTN
jgi:DNA-directed RNA polymerase specialized sigma24 family protein